MLQSRETKLDMVHVLSLRVHGLVKDNIMACRQSYKDERFWMMRIQPSKCRKIFAEKQKFKSVCILNWSRCGKAGWEKFLGGISMHKNSDSCDFFHLGRTSEEAREGKQWQRLPNMDYGGEGERVTTLFSKSPWQWPQLRFSFLICKVDMRMSKV